MKKQKSPPAEAEGKKKESLRRVYTDENGVRHWVRGKSEQVIADKIAAIKQDVKMGRDPKDDKQTVEAWAEKWLKTYMLPKVRKPGTPKKRGTLTLKSYQMYEQKINLYIIPAIGKYRLRDVRPAHIQALLNKEQGTSDSHVKKLRMVVKDLFAGAVKNRILTYNPAEDLELPEAPKGKRRSLTPYEREILLQVAKTHRCGLWIRFLLATGIRPGESAPLQVRDLDLKSEQPTVKIYKNIESGTERAVGEPKTEAGNRVIPLPWEIVDDLREATEGKAPDDFVFPQVDGKTMKGTTAISNDWRSFARQMDLAMGAEHTNHGHIYDPGDLLPNGKPKYPDPNDKSKPRNGHRIAEDLVLYCLRHTYCTDLQRKGVPLNVARYLMGHADISTTANIYTHSGEEEVALAGSLINQPEEKPGAKQRGNLVEVG